MLENQGIPVQGAQVVGRVALLLRLVGRNPAGTPLAEIIRESGLTRPTVHRLLSSLPRASSTMTRPATSGTMGRRFS
jgi:DNA-binding IclR family transcriptional regulator